MKSGNLFLVVVAVVMFFGGSAMAQLEGNRLCIHNGGEYFTNGSFHGFPNQGGGRYFPSFTHNPSVPLGPYLLYSWKISGWAWTGMQANNFGPIWVWHTCLQRSIDNPRSTSMSFDYPVLFCTGVVSHIGYPMPIYGATVPPITPKIAGHGIIYPSSMGNFSPYLNIFAVGVASWVIPTTQPYYGWEFGFVGPCNSAITLPSSDSVWEYVWQQKGPNPQYLILSGNEMDCLGGGGNKGRNYSIIGDFDNGYLWAWLNQCQGTGVEWAMCLFVCDTVTIPVNVPGAPNNPFASYGFDVGTGTVTPYLSSGSVQLGFMTEDYNGSASQKIVLASFAFSPGPMVYGKNQYRIGCLGFDILTALFLNIAPVFAHSVSFSYPACMFGTTTGGHSMKIPFPPDPALMCAEIKYATYDTAPDEPPSASYMATYF